MFIPIEYPVSYTILKEGSKIRSGYSKHSLASFFKIISLKGVFTFFDVEHIFNPPVPEFTPWNLVFFGAFLRPPDPKIGSHEQKSEFRIYIVPQCRLGPPKRIFFRPIHSASRP